MSRRASPRGGSLFLVAPLTTLRNLSYAPGVPIASIIVNANHGGVWRVHYYEGGQEVFQTFEQWHSDGQEFESSNEALGVLCQGTWQAVGHSGVQLFHTWWSFDPATGALD